MSLNCLFLHMNTIQQTIQCSRKVEWGGYIYIILYPVSNWATSLHPIVPASLIPVPSATNRMGYSLFQIENTSLPMQTNPDWGCGHSSLSPLASLWDVCVRACVHVCVCVCVCKAARHPNRTTDRVSDNHVLSDPVIFFNRSYKKDFVELGRL